MNESAMTEPDKIQNLIFTLRGLQVMLDKDIARFFGIKPIRLREQVRRNLKRFPSDFMFQLTEEEVEFMVSQNAIPSKKQLGGSLPLAFTEQGVAGLSAVLTSDKAVEAHIQIMRAFVAMRRFLAQNSQIFQRLETIERKQIETDSKFKQIFDALEERQIIPEKGVFFDGQVFDAHVLVSKIIRSARKSIVLIDNYIDDSVLELLAKRNKNVPATIFTMLISRQLYLDLEKHNQQYPAIMIKEFKNSHDRFIIIDESHVYHFGASLKDLGKKWFAFSKMNIGALEMLQKVKQI